MQNQKTENIINLIVGDWSGDGHGKTDTVTIKCNLTAKQVEAAYDKGARSSGFDPSSYVCVEYEERKIYEEDLEKLRDLGYDVEAHLGITEHDDEVELDVDAFCEIYMFVAYLGDKSIVWEFENPLSSNIHVGGYGLFE